MTMKSARARDQRVIAASKRMIEADEACDSLARQRPDKAMNCEDVPGYLAMEKQFYHAADDLMKLRAHSAEGIVAKARALLNPRLFVWKGSVDPRKRHQRVAALLAKDLLKYFGAGVGRRAA